MKFDFTKTKMKKMEKNEIKNGWTPPKKMGKKMPRSTP